MSLAPFLILPLVGGYAFAATWSYTRFLVARETGHRLYFRSVFYAVLSLAVGATFHLVATTYWGWYEDLLDFIAQLLGYPRDPTLLADRTAKVLILVGSLFIGPILGHILNLPKTANRESRLALYLPA